MNADENLGLFFKMLMDIQEDPGPPHIRAYRYRDPYWIDWPDDVYPLDNEAEWFYENDPEIRTDILFGNRSFTLVKIDS